MRVAPRRLRAGWASLVGSGGSAAVGLGLLVACCVFLATAAPRENLALRTEALQRQLSAASPLQRYVTGTVNYSGYGSGFRAPPGSSDLAATRTELAGHLIKNGLPLGNNGGGWTELSTSLVPVAGLPPSLSAGLRPPQMKVLYRDDLTRYAGLVAGRLPSGVEPAPARTTVLEVAVTSATAARFGLHPGSRVEIGSLSALVVTGVVRPLTPRSPFWESQPLAAAPMLANKSANAPAYWTGAAFVAPQELGRLPAVFDPAEMSLSWTFPLVLGSLTAAQASSLNQALIQVQTQPLLPVGASGILAGPEPITISSGVAGVLGRFVQQDRATGQVLDMLSVSLSTVGAVVVLLGAYLAAERRRREFAALRARGASTLELALLALRTAVAVVLPAAVVAGALAVVLTPGDSEPLAWLLPALTVAVALASLPSITVWQHRRLAPAAVAELGGGRRRAAPRLAAEVALVAAAAGGLAVLAQNGQSSAAGVAVYPSMAPVLVAVPAAIVVMRLYPPALRGLRHLTRIRSGVATFVGFTRGAMAPAATVLPVFALVLALSVVAFGSTVGSAINSGETATSWRRTGADAVIDASTSTRTLGPAAWHAIATVPGVEHTAGIAVLPGSVGGQELTVAALEPSQYATLIAATPAPAFPAASLAWRPVGQGLVPALASPAARQLVGRRSALGVGTGQIEIRTAGTAPRIPGVDESSLVVIPVAALGANRPLPTILLVVGPHLDGPRLEAVVRRELPGASVTLRSAVLASLSGAPVASGASAAIALGTAAAAALSALVILVGVLLSAPARQATLARLRVLGLAPRQANWLVVAEVLPQIVAGAAGGIACAVAMAPLLGGSIDLSAFTGEPGATGLRPQPAVLAATAGGLLVVGMVTLAVEIASRRGRTVAVQDGEG